MRAKPAEHFSAYADGRDQAWEAPLRLERRRRARTPLHWHVCFFDVDGVGTVETTTQDLSSAGFQCLSPVEFLPGRVTTCTLKVPAYQPHSAARMLSLECSIRIVWAKPAAQEGLYAIGCKIEDYRFFHNLVR